jgi:RHS repeat-associated protein
VAAYFHADVQSSIRALTNAAGVITQTGEYEPYGVPRSSSPATPAQPLGFAGQYTDPGGLQHLRARQYDPKTGMFTAPDPAESPGAAGSYTYAGGNPMVYGDPDGLWPSVGTIVGQVRAAAPIIATVATIASFVPVLTPIAGPIALIAGGITALDSAYTTYSECDSTKGSCGAAIARSAAISVAVIPCHRKGTQVRPQGRQRAQTG